MNDEGKSKLATFVFVRAQHAAPLQATPSIACAVDSFLGSSITRSRRATRTRFCSSALAIFTNCSTKTRFWLRANFKSR
jgi:hypothetical protein